MSPQFPAPRSDVTRTYRLVIMLGALFAVVFLVFPVLLTPEIELPAHSLYRRPLSMAVRISNRNPFEPLTDVEYSCEILNVTLATGAEVTDAYVLTRGLVQKFDGRRPITAPCETAYIVNAPVKAAEYRLTLTYRSYPWPQRRRNVYRIAAEVDGNGRVIGWELH